MNKKNLEQILSQYINRFDELHAPDGNDEGYKWRAESWFKENWNVDADDFSEMFKLSMKETSNLIDNATVQPIGGILLLLKQNEEIEFVRECFRLLFSEDKGNLEDRQERIDAFADKINERINRYASGSWKYPQKRNNVIYYMNLWKPEQNYIFKATEATAWADCIEYGSDFGSGTSFSLRKYYKMCDELLAAISENQELIQLYSEMAAKEVRGFDDKLHILVYDIIYCAHAYNFYAGMHIPKTSARERIKLAELREEREELEQQIAEHEETLQSLMEVSNELPDLTGQQVSHKKYGKGTVKSCESGMLLAKFLIEEKKFQYPNALIQGYLTLEDGSVVDTIKEVSKRAEQIAAINKEIANLKGSLEVLQ